MDTRERVSIRVPREKEMNARLRREATRSRCWFGVGGVAQGVLARRGDGRRYRATLRDYWPRVLLRGTLEGPDNRSGDEQSSFDAPMVGSK